MYSKLFLFLTAALLLLGSVTITPTLFAAGTTLTVTGYGDFPDLNPGDGACDTIMTLPGNQCSLRAAIEELNALGPDTTPHNIEFNISGTGPFTITPASPLPAITVPLVIGGQTQPGASCPTPNASANLMIVLDGSNAGTGAVGLVLQSGSDDSTIRGLVIGNFDLSGIRVFSNNNKVRCSHIGLGANGIANIGNHYGITLYGEGNTIGGQLSSSQRNVISGNQSGVLLATGSHNNEVLNNFIGTTATGASELGNSYAGIYVAGDNNLIGGATENRRNVISGNELGIHILGGQNNIIFGNYIGVASDGVTPLPNVFGIALIGETNANVVGGTAGGEANLIAYNSALGVYLVDYSGEIPVENEIRGNTIFANDSLAIDLGANGIDTNDPGDGDFGENEVSSQ